MIRQAVVLAAGLGLRMRPLTLDRPKPLIEVAGRTMLDRALDRLVDAGVGTAAVNSHYFGEMVGAHLARRARPRIRLSPEETLLDTGGGTRRALGLLDPAEPAFVVNGDTIWLDGPTPALVRMARMWDPARMDALLLVMPTTRAIGFPDRGDYHLDPAGRLVRRRERETAAFVFASVQVVTPALYHDTPAGAFSNNLVWDRAQAAGRLYGLVHDGALFHVGTPDALAEVETLIRGAPTRWPAP